MNKALYTLLIAAVSVGITLAFVKGCSEKCACDDFKAGHDDSVETRTKDGVANDDQEDPAATVSGDRSSGQPSPASGEGNAAQEHRLTKYGDAETGGNVYTKGGYTPERPPGKKLVKPDTLQPTKGGSPNPLKTGSDGQRNN